ncbi:MAG: class D sortase [Clostridia bacterium]|nr:class D sortase [Clostridia bacterium]
MLNKQIIKRTIKTAISDIIAVFLILLIMYLGIILLGRDYINSLELLLNTYSIVRTSKNETNNIDLKLDVQKNKLIEYPEYGTKYATVEIDSIGVNLPLYYGDSLDILKKGIGQSTASWFPGEGGSIICMGHNYQTMLRNFGKLQNGDIIKVTTDYGEFNYKIYDMQIVKETEKDKLPLQKDEEIFMIYTCYPFNNVGYTTKRYVVFAKPIGQEVG